MKQDESELSPESPPKVAVVIKKDEREEERGKGGKVALEYLARLMKKDESEEDGGELSPEYPPK